MTPPIAISNSTKKIDIPLHYTQFAMCNANTHHFVDGEQDQLQVVEHRTLVHLCIECILKNKANEEKIGQQ